MAGQTGQNAKERGRTPQQSLDRQPTENMSTIRLAGRAGQIGQKSATYTQDISPPDPPEYARARNPDFSAPSAPNAPKQSQTSETKCFFPTDRFGNCAPIRGRSRKAAPIFEECGCRGAGCGRRWLAYVPPGASQRVALGVRRRTATSIFSQHWQAFGVAWRICQSVAHIVCQTNA